ncbi:hypothetical protein C8R41DRAFT_418330 [Lentinula lateritia]|uniref:Uncharacterized protein n=1 Tax=Lentinula lateritia TaxID=40482 RepID=A0ABQ8VBR8_9AGAR|nr:hypothetical protein C8R41DRAFT_418330 [Lentinula lateritia]
MPAERINREDVAYKYGHHNSMALDPRLQCMQKETNGDYYLKGEARLPLSSLLRAAARRALIFCSKTEHTVQWLTFTHSADKIQWDINIESSSSNWILTLQSLHTRGMGVWLPKLQ